MVGNLGSRAGVARAPDVRRFCQTPSSRSAVHGHARTRAQRTPAGWAPGRYRSAARRPVHSFWKPAVRKGCTTGVPSRVLGHALISEAAPAQRSARAIGTRCRVVVPETVRSCVEANECSSCRVRQCRPLTWSTAGVARPAATADGVGHVLRLRSDSKVVGPNPTPDIAAMTNHRLLEHAAVGDHRPAVRSDVTQPVAAEPGVATVGLDPTEPDPARIATTEVDPAGEATALIGVDVRPVRCPTRRSDRPCPSLLPTTLTEGCVSEGLQVPAEVATTEHRLETAHTVGGWPCRRFGRRAVEANLDKRRARRANAEIATLPLGRRRVPRSAENRHRRAGPLAPRTSRCRRRRVGERSHRVGPATTASHLPPDVVASCSSTGGAGMRSYRSGALRTRRARPWLLRS